ncbi:hypothetical protein BC834DRAFT_971835 [Gloeopeniophorella convolvens]|nr:hypothetical protein BC834DRAFT_971835 [Gloeopeniophorella convolvens]
MSSSVWQYLDIEAEHTDDNGEDEVDEEEDWGPFFGDDEDLGSEDQRPTDLPVKELAAVVEDAGALERLARSFRPEPRNARIVSDVLVASQGLLLQVTAPHIGDPGMWCVRVKFGREREAVAQLAQRCIDITGSQPPSIVSVFNRDGIGGHIFLEARALPDVIRALEGMAFVRPSAPRPIDVDRRIELFTSPAPRRLDEAQGGCWVRVTRGLHLGDIGFVHGANDELDDHLDVMIVPRVPQLMSTARSWSYEMGYDIPNPKRRKLGRPPARPLTVSDAVALYGQKFVQVCDMEGDVFFCGEVLFIAGLARYWVPRCCLEVVDEMPSDLGLFARTGTARDWLNFSKWFIKAAQDSIREGMRIVVVRGSLRGIVGHVTSILNGAISIRGNLAAGGTRSYDQIERADVLPHFMPGDSVKGRWSSSRGMVIMASYDPDKLVYIDQNRCEVTIHTYQAELHSPELHTASLRPGVWVNYVGPPRQGGARIEGYGCIVVNDGEFVYVEDGEKKRAEDGETKRVTIRCNAADVEVAARQREASLPIAQLLPCQTDAQPLPLIPELLHKEVIVLHGPLKGRAGTVRDHTVYGAMVILHTDLAINAMNARWFDWGLLLVRPSIGPLAPRMLPESPPRGRTATPEPDRSDRETTPPPRDQPRRHASECKRAEDHWIHWRQIQEIMATKRLAMAIRERDGSSGKSAKTVPLPQRTLQPGAGEVIVSTVPGRRFPRQVSMDPRELVQRPAALQDSVVVIDGRWLGWTGKVTKVADAGGPLLRLCTVELDATFPDPQRSRDLLAMDLVIIED